MLDGLSVHDMSPYVLWVVNVETIRRLGQLAMATLLVQTQCHSLSFLSQSEFDGQNYI